MGKYSQYRWVFLTIGIVFFYWFLESLLDALFFYEGGFSALFFHPVSHEVWMRLIIVATIVVFGVFAQRSINRLRDSEEEIKELHSLLLSLRNINQLIVQESDLEELFQKSADALLEARGYIDISIAVLGEGEISPIAHSGGHEREEWSVTPEGKGEVPMCVSEVLESKSSKIISSVEEYCKECKFCEHGLDHQSVIVPLLHENSPVGFLVVCVGKELGFSDDELEHLEEIADDLAFAREKIRAERIVKKSEERYRGLFESANVAIIVYDSEGEIFSVNPRAEEALGLNGEELKDKGLEYWEGELFDENGEPMEGGEFPISDVYDSKEPVDGTVVGISPNSMREKIRWYILTAEPQFDDVGEIERVIVSFKDITEEKELSERKEFLNAMLRQDLGSKLQAVQGYLQLLEDVDSLEEESEYLEEIFEMIRESDEVLSLARELREIEEANWSAEKDIVQVLKRVLEDISVLIEDEGVELEEDYSDDVGNVKGDYSLKILFSELLKNRIRTSECDKIKISAEEGEEKVLVSVEDDGESLLGEVEDLLSGRVYTGETTGAGGVRYYMISQIAEHNNINIEVRDSELGGPKFNIHMQKP